MKFFKIGLAAMIAASLLTGCGKNAESSEDDSSSVGGATKDYDLFIYNDDSEIEENFSKMCEDYGSRAGVIVKSVTVDPEEDAEEQINAYMSSSNPPDIFTVNNMKELKKWQESGSVLDFSNVGEEEFKEIANKIPKSLRLSSNTVDNFGMPYTIEGYGYLVDPKMLSSLFGGDKYRAVLSDLKACTYDEFQGLVNALKLYISSGEIYEFQLNGQTYSLLDKKSGISENLNGVFSVSAGTVEETGVYMADSALASAFNSAAEANTASDEKIASLISTFSGLAKALDLRTSSVSGKNGPAFRGIELVDVVSNSPNQSIKNFVSGRSLFLLAKNTDYETVNTYDSSVAKRASFIPIKMPFSEEDITASDMTEKNYNLSIPVSVPRYFCINAKSSEKEQKLAQDFLVWFKTSELAQKYIIQEFGFIPYDVEESSAIDNPFSRSMIEYVSAGKILPAVSRGAPLDWSDTFAKFIIDQYYTKTEWGFDDYDEIAAYGVKKWKELK